MPDPVKWRDYIDMDGMTDTPASRKTMESALDFYFDTDQGKETLGKIKNAYEQSGKKLSVTESNIEDSSFTPQTYQINIPLRGTSTLDPGTGKIFNKSFEEIIAHEMQHVQDELDTKGYGNYLAKMKMADDANSNISKANKKDLDDYVRSQGFDPASLTEAQFDKIQDGISKINDGYAAQRKEIKEGLEGDFKKNVEPNERANFDTEQRGMAAEDRFRKQTLNSPYQRDYDDGFGSYLANVHQSGESFSYGEMGFRNFNEAKNAGYAKETSLTPEQLQKMQTNLAETTPQNSGYSQEFLDDAKKTLDELQQRLDKTGSLQSDGREHAGNDGNQGNETPPSQKHQPNTPPPQQPHPGSGQSGGSGGGPNGGQNGGAGNEQPSGGNLPYDGPPSFPPNDSPPRSTPPTQPPASPGGDGPKHPSKPPNSPQPEPGNGGDIAAERVVQPAPASLNAASVAALQGVNLDHIKGFKGFAVVSTKVGMPNIQKINDTNNSIGTPG